MLIVIIVITLLIVAVPLGCYLMLTPQGQRSPFSELARQIGSTKHWFGRWTGVHQDIHYEYVLRTAFDSRFASESRLTTDEYLRLRVRVSSTPMLKFRVTRKTGGDRFWQRLGIGTVAKTGDADFDREFLVDQKGPDLPSGFFADADRRKAVATILDRGFRSVAGNGVCLEAYRDQFSLSRHPDPGLITGTVENLAKLIGDGTTIPTRTPIPSQLLFRARAWAITMAKAVLYVAFIAVVVLGLFRFPPLNRSESYLMAFWPSLLVVALIGWGLFRLARARKWSPRKLTANALIVVVVIPVLIWSSLVWLNGGLDQQPAESHIAKILQRTESSKWWQLLSTRDQPVSHYLDVQSWHDPDATERLSVSASTYAMAMDKSYALKVTTGSGRLGLEWLESYELVKTTDAD